MGTRPVSPHEKAFMKRQGGNRFSVTPANMPKPRRSGAIGYKPLLTKMMESSGRRSFVRGQKPPTPARVR